MHPLAETAKEMRDRIAKFSESQRIEWFGANARARGELMNSNPYRKPATLPGDLAEAPEVRERKAMSWDAGWAMEDLVRG